MDGLIRSVGNGITGLVAGAVDAIGGALRGMVGALNSALPPFALPVIVVGLALLVFWFLIKR